MHKENAHQVSELHEILSEYLLAADSSNCSLIRTLKIDMNYGKYKQKTYQIFSIPNSQWTCTYSYRLADAAH